MIFRSYIPTDCRHLAELFYQTVHTINARDYTLEQLNVWADGHVDLEAWNRSFLEHHTIVAIEEDNIVGFGDIDESGYLDRLYVHKDYQHKGIGTAICDRLEHLSGVDQVITHASITAKFFFIQRGYKVINEQQIIRKGIALTNYVMDKKIPVIDSIS